MLGIHVDVAAHCQHPVPERAADVAHCLAVGVQPPGDPVFPLIGDEVDKAGLNLVFDPVKAQGGFVQMGMAVTEGGKEKIPVPIDRGLGAGS